MSSYFAWDLSSYLKNAFICYKCRCFRSSCAAAAAKIPLIRVISAKDGNNSGPNVAYIDQDDSTTCHSVVVENKNATKKKNDLSQKNGERHYDCYGQSQPNGNGNSTANGNGNATTANGSHHAAPQPHPPPSNGTNGAAPPPTDEELLKLKRVRFVRRVSGPFSDEAMGNFSKLESNNV
jgi:hypothetical protein